MADKYAMPAFIAVFIIALSSCSTDNYSASRPVYFAVPDFLLETNYLDEGTSNSKITTVWIYQDNDLQGTYEIPCTVPVIVDQGNSHTYRIFAGINLNGISSSRAIYEFYDRPLFDTALPADLDTFLLPQEYRTTNYSPGSTVTILENFDEAGLNLAPTSGSDTTIRKVSDANLVFQNTQNPSENNGRAGVLTTSNSILKAEVASVSTYNLPTNGKNVYLELNYRCNQQFVVGVIANSLTGASQQPTVVINPREEWNKIYINLVSELSGNRDADNFNIFLGTIHDSQNDTGRVYLDNLKLVY
jgi:hypothetical protein